MSISKGYIPVKGKIKGYSFLQTLVPVKNAPYRLYVNGFMLKGSAARVGDRVKFLIEEDTEPVTVEQMTIPAVLKRQLTRNKLSGTFSALTPYRQKEILRYLNILKTEEALLRNVEKIIRQLQQKN